MNDNDTEVGLYVGKLDEIDAIAERLFAFVEDHGDLEPDAIQMRDVSRLNFALITLRAACEILGIDLTAPEVI